MPGELLVRGLELFVEVLQDLNRRLVAAAYERTTRLSANLIECAALGESDERLLNVVDCILTGSPPVAECLPELLTWGSSSGVDALAGMAVATLAKRPFAHAVIRL